MKCILYSEEDVLKIYITALEQNSIITAIAALMVDNQSIILYVTQEMSHHFTDG